MAARSRHVVNARPARSRGVLSHDFMALVIWHPRGSSASPAVDGVSPAIPTSGSGKAISARLERLGRPGRRARPPPRGRRPPAARRRSVGVRRARTRCAPAPPPRSIGIGARERRHDRPPGGHRTPRRSGASCGHRQVADAHFAQAWRPCPAEQIEHPLAELGAPPRLRFQAPQHQHRVQHDHLKTPVNRIRHTVGTIERRGSRLRHDHAIERRRC